MMPLYSFRPCQMEGPVVQTGSWRSAAHPIALSVIGAALLVMAARHGAALAEETDSNRFVAIFDGQTLDSWHAVPDGTDDDWSVQHGVIVGIGSADRNAFLVWDDEDLTDFELELKYRLPGEGNTGVEIRAQPDKSGKRPFEAYHADLGHVGIGTTDSRSVGLSLRHANRVSLSTRNKTRHRREW